MSPNDNVIRLQNLCIGESLFFRVGIGYFDKNQVRNFIRTAKKVKDCNYNFNLKVADVGRCGGVVVTKVRIHPNNVQYTNSWKGPTLSYKDKPRKVSRFSTRRGGTR